MWQHVKLSEQIRPWGTLACCWDVKQPTNKQTLMMCLCLQTCWQQLDHWIWFFVGFCGRGGGKRKVGGGGGCIAEVGRGKGVGLGGDVWIKVLYNNYFHRHHCRLPLFTSLTDLNLVSGSQCQQKQKCLVQFHEMPTKPDKIWYCMETVKSGDIDFFPFFFFFLV